MAFELIVQLPFTQRLAGNAVRIRTAGEHIVDPAEIVAVKRDHGTSVVQVWVDDPVAAAVAPEPEAKPAEAAASTPEHSTAAEPDAH